MLHANARLISEPTFNEEIEQFAVTAVLRPGTAPALRGARGLLRRLLRQLRAAFPTAVLPVRLDGGFASAQLFAFLEREQVEMRRRDAELRGSGVGHYRPGVPGAPHARLRDRGPMIESGGPWLTTGRRTLC